MPLNLRDIEDAWSQATADYDSTMAEFEAEWNAPLVETLLGVDMFVNQDIYRPGMMMGGMTNGEDRDIYGQRRERQEPQQEQEEEEG